MSEPDPDKLHRERKLIDERDPKFKGQDTPPGTPAAPLDPYAPMAAPDPVGRDKKAPYSHKNVKHPPHIPESGIPQEEEEPTPTGTDSRPTV